MTMHYLIQSRKTLKTSRKSEPSLYFQSPELTPLGQQAYPSTANLGRIHSRKLVSSPSVFPVPNGNRDLRIIGRNSCLAIFGASSSCSIRTWRTLFQNT